MIVGVLGAGQLGRMLALAGYPLGLRFRFLDPSPDAAAGHLAQLIVAPYDSEHALERLALGAAAVTYEFENVPLQSAEYLASRTRVRPPPTALAAAQDRLYEKQLFNKLGIPTPEFAAVDSRAALDEAIARVRLPAVLKTRRLGYDGKGQFVLRSGSDVAAAWLALGDAPLILERYVPFERELSILAVRGQDGQFACYPLIENRHRNGILTLSLAPAPQSTLLLQQTAAEYAHALVDELEYVGLLALELFQFQGRLLANEMAPRVHNSGHWTIEGARTSQFENHLRAVLGWELGPAESVGCSAMVNLIGEVPDVQSMLRVPGAHVHLYGKSPAAGRKLGHVTLWGEGQTVDAQRLAKLLELAESASTARTPRAKQAQTT